MNDLILETILKEKRHDMLQEAARLRMVREYERSLPSLKKRLMAHIAMLLIRSGEKLQQKYSISGKEKTSCPEGSVLADP